MSEWSQRRKVSVDTPAAVASSDLSIAFIGFRSNFPQLLSAFLGSFCLHPCNDPGDGGETGMMEFLFFGKGALGLRQVAQRDTSGFFVGTEIHVSEFTGNSGDTRHHFDFRHNTINFRVND